MTGRRQPYQESIMSADRKKELAKAYEFRDVEERWYRRWLAEKKFAASMDEGKESFSMVIPPPNVTGVLHVGHALNNTLQDILVRYQRMCGKNTLWVPGTDHAGIATQNVVERQLAAEGKSRHDLGRERFIERVWQWREESGGQIINQLKRLGCSCDWDRERFTMDEGLSRAVREVFVRLHEEGLIYRGDYIINWCPRCHTALADLEVEHEPTDGKLYHIRYPFADGSGHVVVATTRPETMLGDTGVAVHPDDERYKGLDRQGVILPLVNRRIPVVLDEHVDREFGTGALKVTPAHDLDDFEIGRRHGLELIKVMDDNGVMNEAAGPYAGLERFACREKIVADLEREGFLEKIEDYQHGVGHCYRCHTVVEPYLSKQWFVAVKPLADAAIAAVKEGRIRLHPRSWENTFYDWMYNIRDWCISRQIWWGHRIPAWTCASCGETVVTMDDPDTCPKCGGSELERETDVLDTWFSSALWPFSTLGWPEKTRELDFFYPTSVLITSFDILFFWVARMMMMGIHFMGEVPFRDVYLHALVRDKHGQKMSKSKGNVMDPLLLMDQYGTDALRFTLTAFAAQGRDIKLSEERIEGYRHFINKIWNAARFALLHLDEPAAGLAEAEVKNLALPHRWILSRANRAVAAFRAGLDGFRFNESAASVYRFVWHELCDWYLEWIKPDLYGDDEEAKRTAKTVLAQVLETALKLLHPIAPFVTEEIWTALPGERESIMTEPFPEIDPGTDDPAAEAEAELLMGVISSIRAIRSDMLIHPTREIPVIVVCPDHEKRRIIEQGTPTIMNLCRAGSLSIGISGGRPKGAASNGFADVEIFVPMQGLIDVEKERAKLEKERAKLEKEIKKTSAKLENRNFLDRAPEEIVEKERGRLSEARARMAKIEENLAQLAEL